MNFLAIDVETANADYSSICQIGIVEFQNSEIVSEWKSLINPQTYFDGFNISIHGITPEDVKSSPTFEMVHDYLISKLANQIVVHHMPFDRVAINRACLEDNLELIPARWLDSARITRRTWHEFSSCGYGLKKISGFLGIVFRHHDALEDAIAAGKVVMKACETTNMSLEDWFVRVEKPIDLNKFYEVQKIEFEGNPEGELFGEVLVFTGALVFPRKIAAQFAAKLGCKVTDSVTKVTTMLVVGIQASSKLAGYEKSSKHRKAEKLISEGHNLRILSENDFFALTGNNESMPGEKLELIKENSIQQPG